MLKNIIKKKLKPADNIIMNKDKKKFPFFRTKLNAVKQ